MILILSCSNFRNQKAENLVQTDTTKSFKIDKYWITPKDTLEFNSLGNINGDTLHLVVCAEYVYSPFGHLEDRTDLKASLLKNFIIKVSKLDTFTNYMVSSSGYKQKYETLEMESGHNKLNLAFDNDTEASKHSYILSGEINDNQVSLLDNIRIGLSIGEFYKAFFTYFPDQLVKRYKVIVFESCVQSITHVYTFENERLKKIIFK